MMDLLAKGKNLPFLDGLLTSLQIIEGAAPGYATMQIKRLAEIPLPIDDNARAFYRRHGLQSSPTDPLHLMIPIKDIAAALNAATQVS